MTAPHRRNEQARQAILKAALELCLERGYGGLTIEGVAVRAGVGKQTIYRWWPSKGAVVLEAFHEALGPSLAVQPDAEDPLNGLETFLRRTADLLSHPTYGPMLADLVGATQHDAALAAEFSEQISAPARAATLARIRSAQEAGQLRQLDPDLIADAFFGPLWFRLLVLRIPPTATYAENLVAALRDGFG